MNQSNFNNTAPTTTIALRMASKLHNTHYDFKKSDFHNTIRNRKNRDNFKNMIANNFGKLLSPQK